MSAALIVILIVLAQQHLAKQNTGARTTDAPTVAGSVQDPAARSALRHAIDNKLSGVIVESSGVVSKVLPDDTDGDEHQRFIVKLDEGQTILIAHNIDLAPRAPIKPGEVVGFKGQFEWNDQGGVVHWTHHDPRGKREDGWLRVAGKEYK